MATRKTGSRRIIVDGTAYRWRVRQRGTRRQADRGIRPAPPPVSDPRDGPGSERLHVAVELAAAPRSVLVVYTAHRHPGHFDTGPWEVVPIRPADVAGWIREALRAGWAPGENGPQFRLRVAGPPPRPDAEPGVAPDRGGVR